MLSQLNHLKVMLSITILGITSSTIIQAQRTDTSQVRSMGHVQASYVCMVDNEYKDSTQLSVELDGKTYFGCCQPCIEYLQSDESIRFALDPLTKQKVNKADAFIAFKNDGSYKIQYFESEINYKKYYNLLKTGNQNKP